MANDGEITYVLLLKQLIHPTIAIFLVVLQLTRVRSVGTIRAIGLPYGIGLGASDSVTERTQLPYSPEVIFGGTRDPLTWIPKVPEGKETKALHCDWFNPITCLIILPRSISYACHTRFTKINCCEKQYFQQAYFCFIYDRFFINWKYSCH